jgi:hypothetical protein
MRRIALLSLVSAACVLALAATAGAVTTYEVTIGPFKAKGYRGGATIRPSSPGKYIFDLVMYSRTKRVEKTVLYDPPGFVKVKRHAKLKRAEVTGKLGGFGKLKLKFRSKTKMRQVGRVLPGCHGSRGFGRRGVFTGRNGFVMKTGDKYFGTIRLRKVKGAIYTPREYRCYFGSDGRDDKYRLAADSAGPSGTEYSLRASDFGSGSPLEALELTGFVTRGKTFSAHRLVALANDHSIFSHPNPPRAAIHSGVGPFLSGSAQFAPGDPACQSYSQGRLAGGLTVKFDTLGTVKPFKSGGSGYYSGPGSTAGC